MRKRLTMVFALVLFAMVHFASTGHAQGSGASTNAQEPGGGACQGCWHNLDTNEHGFAGSTGYYDCKALNTCHGDPQSPFSCSVYHWDCGTTLGFLETDRARKSINPEQALVALASSRPSVVRRTSSGYVVVKNCKGQIVAAYRVGTSVESKVRANSGRNSRAAGTSA